MAGAGTILRREAAVQWADSLGNKVTQRLSFTTGTSQAVIEAVILAISTYSELYSPGYSMSDIISNPMHAAVAKGAGHNDAEANAAAALVYLTAVPGVIGRMSIPGPLEGVITGPLNTILVPSTAATAILTAGGGALTNRSADVLTAFSGGKLEIRKRSA